MSSQCFTFDFSSASFIMYFSFFPVFIVYNLFSVSLLPSRISSVKLYSSCNSFSPCAVLLYNLLDKSWFFLG